MKSAPRRRLLTCAVVACITQVVLSSDVQTQARKRNFSFVFSTDPIREPTRTVPCPDGQIYDPYQDKCRSRRCPPTGYTLSNGICVRLNNTEACPKGEKYDPFFKKCRLLACALPGYVISNGKCIKQ